MNHEPTQKKKVRFGLWVRHATSFNENNDALNRPINEFLRWRSRGKGIFISVNRRVPTKRRIE
jgi:hypothetical protein